MKLKKIPRLPTAYFEPNETLCTFLGKLFVAASVELFLQGSSNRCDLGRAPRNGLQNLCAP